MVNPGLNIRSTFFTELSGVTQVTGLSFGPKGTTQQSKENVFRITTSFSSSSSKKAFAICKSRIFIQPQSGDSTKVNALLQPINQPSSRLPIKYFIYRGLDVNSFFDSSLSGGETQLVLNANKSSASTLVQNLWNKFIAFNGLPTNTTDPFLSKWIGYDPANQSGSDLLAQYLEKLSPDDLSDSSQPSLLFELPIIDEGTWLGNCTTAFGFEVVLDHGKDFIKGSGVSLDLNYLRASEYEVDISNLPSGTLEKSYRETILNFLDPAAFYGAHYPDGVVDTLDNSETLTTKTLNDIYNDIISKFENKNSHYIIVESIRGRSYNYYNEHEIPQAQGNMDLKISEDNSVYNYASYNHYKWPIHVYSSDQNHSNNFNSFFIRFNALAQRHIAYVQFSNFIFQSTNTSSFFEINPDEKDEPWLTKSLTLELPNLLSGSVSQTVSGLTYLIIDYRLETVLNASNDKFLLKSIDEIFHLNQSSYDHTTTGIRQVVGKAGNNNLLTRAINVQALCACQGLAVFDHITNPNDDTDIRERSAYEVIVSNCSDLTVGVNSLLQSKSGFAKPFLSSENNYHHPENEQGLFLEFFLIEISPNSVIKGIKLSSTGSETTSNKGFLGISKLENDALNLVANNSQLRESRIYLSSKYPGKISSLNMLDYFVYTLGLTGEDSLGNVVFEDVTPEIQVYSLDNLTFFSQSYSEFIDEEEVVPISQEVDIIIDNISL